MSKWKNFSRAFLFILLIIGLCAGMVVPRLEPVQAAPKQAASVYAGDIVISEFRTTGANGSSDEFIELFNRSGQTSPSLLNWSLEKSSSCGSTTGVLVSSLPNITLDPGQHYLIGNSGGYTGAADTTFTSAIADDGGIALLDNSGGIVDQVGMCPDTLYIEGTNLGPLSKSVDQSYERKNLGCTDTNDNAADFSLNASSSNPQTYSDAPLPCVRVVNVSSMESDGTYTTGVDIRITIQFNAIVTVTGTPTLLLETGATDRTAVYKSGSGNPNKTLIFTYTVTSGDSSADLDYVATSSLTLNGGSIVGASGSAVLTLPAPGAPGSLGANKNIIIDDGVAPSVVSIKRQTPSATPTNADTLVFRVTFSEAVKNVDASDFIVDLNSTPPTTTAMVTNAVSSGNGLYSDVTISGGDLASFNGVVGLDFSSAQNIQDITNKPLSSTSPTINQTYTVDNKPPTITIDRSSGQLNPASSTPINFDVRFSEAIDISTFMISDITQSGSANYVTWKLTDLGDHINFNLSAVSVADPNAINPGVTIIPVINAGLVSDRAGNLNTISAPTNPGGNQVDFQDNVPPDVTVNQASTQSDPTITLPVKFSVVFSEPINASTFMTSDITQNGTATGVTWSIVDSGDHTVFTLSATSATSTYGTLIPSIAANRVLDVVGNNNAQSTSTDNSVLYDSRPTPTPTNTATSTPSPSRAVIISEVAWAGTSALGTDEWVELYNPGSKPVNITGWKLQVGSNQIDLIGTTINVGGYFLLERREEAVSDVKADQIVPTLSLSNSGTILKLLDSSGKEIDSANPNGAPWYAGNSSSYGTMERIFIQPNFPNNSSFYWETNKGIFKNGKDALGNDIWGTPKRSSSPTPTPTATLPPPTRTPTRLPERTLLINEIAWMGTAADYSDEWVELYNPGSLPIDLAGWNLRTSDGALNYTLTSGRIESKKFYLLASASDVFSDLNVQQVFNGSINNYSTSLQLLDPSGTVIDIANGNRSYYWPAGQGYPNYATMERYRNQTDGLYSWVTYAYSGTPLHSVHDRSGNLIKGTPGYANWAASVTITPTLVGTATRTPYYYRTTPTPALEGRLVINEFLPRPGYDWNQDGKADMYDEFIEIKNIGTLELNIKNWQLDDIKDGGSTPYTLPSLTLQPGERAVFFGSETKLQLSDGGDAVRLVGPNGKEYDKYTYVVARYEDKSTCRLPDGNGSWYEDCIPTPNMINTRTGTTPVMPGADYQSPVCSLPDTLPSDFLFAECRGYGAGIWRFMFWDLNGWLQTFFIPDKNGKWDSFIE